MKVIFSADLAKEELRVVASMADSLTPPTDPYRRRAAEKYGVPYVDVTTEQRQAMKVEMFRELYSSPRVWPIYEPLPK